MSEQQMSKSNELVKELTTLLNRDEELCRELQDIHKQIDALNELVQSKNHELMLLAPKITQLRQAIRLTEHTP